MSKSRVAVADSQTELPGVTSAAEVFRRLYYHLYSNSRTTRAEKIFEDLSLLLLIKLLSETHDEGTALSDFRTGVTKTSDGLVSIARKTYPDLVSAHQQFSLGDDAVRLALSELEAVDLSTAPAHVIGDAFQALMGPRLRGDRGQFFTPRSLVRAMVRITNPQPHEDILDPACGTGGFLLEAHVHQSANTQPTGSLVGVDKDEGLARLAAALLEVASGGRAKVHSSDSLDQGQWDGEPSQFDVILTNPPFGARIGIKSLEILRSLDFGHQWVASDADATWVKTGAVLASQDPQTLFIEVCVRRLKPGGRLGIVLPEGVFGNRGVAYVWDWLREQGEVTALLDCPRTTFQPSTDTKTNVLFFRKWTEGGPDRSTRSPGIRVGVALQCGHDRRGRSTRSDGTPYPDDFPELAANFHQKRTKAWRTIKPTNPYYLVPRYYAEEGPTSVQEAELVAGAETLTLQELVEAGVISIRKGHEVGSEAYGTGDIPFVRTSDIANFEIRVDPTNGVSEEVYSTYAPQQKLRPGDILVVADGRYRIGTSAILTENNDRCVVQSHLRVISVADESDLRPHALLYALNLPSVRLRIRDLVFVQSTLGTLGKRLFELKVPVFRGQGPWSEPIARFERTLRERDALLSEVRNLAGAEVDL